MRSGMRSAVALLPLLLLAPGCGSGDDSITGSRSATIALEAVDVTADGVHLAVTATADMSGMPLWRTDVDDPLTHMDLESGMPGLYTDHDVVPGHMYCYMAGGDDAMSGPDHDVGMLDGSHSGMMNDDGTMGSVHSNEECVAVPD